MTWCWHPVRTVTRQPLPTDYRCCLGCCTSKCGFTTLTILNIICLSLTLIVDIFEAIERKDGSSVWHSIILPLGIQIFLLIFCVLALKTGKPVWMQIFWCLQLFFTFVIISFMLIWLAMAILVVSATSGKEHQRIGHVILGQTIFGILIIGAYLFWYLSLIYSYYSYLRDKQLWREQAGASMSRSQYQAESQPMYPKLIDQTPSYPGNQPNYPRQV